MNSLKVIFDDALIDAEQIKSESSQLNGFALNDAVAKKINADSENADSIAAYYCVYKIQRQCFFSKSDLVESVKEGAKDDLELFASGSWNSAKIGKPIFNTERAIEIALNFAIEINEAEKLHDIEIIKRMRELEIESIKKEARLKAVSENSNNN
jgi:hypothetical protein